ncbi:UNVERIFIED_CONTAM: hypothetical protein HDU68_009138 [Siphonaria sp. JEL0065]|nr:hypothetical protein HDU68_009138 [Siphonaria sp. JEL0065]
MPSSRGQESESDDGSFESAAEDLASSESSYRTAASQGTQTSKDRKKKKGKKKVVFNTSTTEERPLSLNTNTNAPVPRISSDSDVPAFFKGRKTVDVPFTLPGVSGGNYTFPSNTNTNQHDSDNDSLDTVTPQSVSVSGENARATRTALTSTPLASPRRSATPRSVLVTNPSNASSPSNANQPPPRLRSLDMFRGATILGMIVANFQVGSRAWPILLHPPWIGLSLADLVFPSFLFIMGVAIPISMKSRKKTYASILIRSLKLIAIGLLLNAPFATLATFRPAGVLQRTGLVFWIVASAYKAIPSPNLFNFVLPSFLLGLWALLTRVLVVPLAGTAPFPDLSPCPAYHDTNFSYFEPPHCTAEAYLDSNLFGRNHTYQHAAFDNEGTLSTLTSCITVIAGVVVGTSLQRAVQNDYSDGTWRIRLCNRLAIQSFSWLLISGLFVLAIGVP